MKIDRRSFLSLGLGVAAGTTLSPLPWKLMDDSAIWTQNWPWTPVPEDGAAHYVNSVCKLCPGSCGISVRKIDDRAVAIYGIKDHPVNSGGICSIGLSGLQLLYDQNRIKTPLIKRKGRFKKISWDEAISKVKTRIDDLRSKGLDNGLCCITGQQYGTVHQLFNRFLTACGSPNIFYESSIQDSYQLAIKLMHGVDALPGFDLENSNFVLSFGSGLIDGWGSPVRMCKANSRWQEKNAQAQVVQIETRLSNTAAKADRWIAINPGTYAALALGLAYVIIKESLYDDNFINKHAFGFYDWTDKNGNLQQGFKHIVLNKYTPDYVESITGIKKSIVISLAKQFASSSNPVAICGNGKGKTAGSFDTFMAVHALNALVGNINKKGGVSAIPPPQYINWPNLTLNSKTTEDLKNQRLDGAGSNRYPHAKSLLNHLPEAINSGKADVQILFVAGANPLYTLPDTKNVKKAFDKIPFKVSFSSYMDETSQNADLILPSHNYLEQYEDIPVSFGSNKPIIGLSKSVIEPQFDTKHVGDSIILIAKALKGSIADAFKWDSYKACLKETLADKWDKLNENGYWIDIEYEHENWNHAFNTPSGKFEFVVPNYSKNVSNNCILLPCFTPVEIEGSETHFSLVLIPYDSMRISSGFVACTPFAMKTVEDTVLKGNDNFVEINPQTAKKYNLAEGKYAILTTPKGKAKVKVHLFEGIMPGVVGIPRGFGHTAHSKYIATKGINYNELIGPIYDSVSGLDSAWGIRATLTRI